MKLTASKVAASLKLRDIQAEHSRERSNRVGFERVFDRDAYNGSHHTDNNLARRA